MVPGKQCFGSALVSIRIQIRILFFTSMRIHIRVPIQGAKPMRIHADPDPDPGQTLTSQKVGFWHENYWPISLFVDPDLHSQYWSGSRRAKSMRICRSGSETRLVSERFYMNMRLLYPVQRQEVERTGDLEHPQAPLCLVHRPEHKSHLRAGIQRLFFRAWIFKELLRNKLSLTLGGSEVL